MSIVEKAAEKLKTRQSEARGPMPEHDRETAVPASSRSASSTIERAQARMPASAPAAEQGPASPWHVEPGALRRAGLSPVARDAENRLADELRRAKRPLLGNVAGKAASPHMHANRIVVTSAVPGEGKTFTAWNLAVSLAREPDFEVVLVDGDVPKSDVTRVLGLQGRPGFMDLLTNPQLRPQDVVVPTDVPDLSVVPAGRRHPLAAELFGGRYMDQVLESLGNRDRQRLLVFDSAPLLATSEAQVMASHMGQVVMVVAAGRTRRQELKAAMQAFDESQYVGLILNKSRLPATESHYYKHYGNYYYNYDDKEA